MVRSVRFSLLLVTLALALTGIGPAAASAAPQTGGSPATGATSAQRASATVAGPGDDAEPAARRAGSGLIAMIWAMTLAGAAGVVVLLRRAPQPVPAPAQA